MKLYKSLFIFIIVACLLVACSTGKSTSGGQTADTQSPEVDSGKSNETIKLVLWDGATTPEAAEP